MTNSQMGFTHFKWNVLCGARQPFSEEETCNDSPTVQEFSPIPCHAQQKWCRQGLGLLATTLPAESWRPSKFGSLGTLGLENDDLSLDMADMVCSRCHVEFLESKFVHIYNYN